MAIFRRESTRFNRSCQKGDGAQNARIACNAIFSLAKASNILFLAFVISTLFTATAILSTSVSADTQGCYLYGAGSQDLVCQSNVLESQATADCAEHADCEISAMFIPGASCDSYSQCEQVLCSVDCDYHSQTVCEELGGRELQPEEEELWCSEGCCTVGNFCEYVSLRYECVQRAQSQGLTESDMTLITGSDISPTYCQTNICGVELESASIFGTIKNSEGEVLQAATVELSSSLSQSTAADGSYSFTSVTPGSYLLRVSKEGYQDSSSSVSLNSAESKELDIVLADLGDTFSFTGKILDEESGPVGSVAICYSSNVGLENCGSSQSDGSFEFADLALGDYTFTLTKYGFLSTEHSITITGTTNQDLVIASIDFQGITGYTWLDENGNEVVDSSESPVYGASLYVNDIVLGNSKYPNGDYELYLDEGTYQVYATYQDYQSEEYELTISSGETQTLDLLLSKIIGECSYGQENDQKPVEFLSSSVTQGSPELTLSWEKPCAQVSGYVLERNGESYQSLSPLATSFVDSDLSWGHTYTYAIWAVYTDGPLEDDGLPEPRLSSSAATTTVTLGNELCEGYNLGQQFCSFDDSDTTVNERKYVYSCDEQNNIIPVTDCTALDSASSGSSYFCSEIGSGQALCKDAGECSVLSQNADPFGLYYEQESCYGDFSSQSGYENFCYYDYTNSIVDACYSCEEVTSCFDYQSQDACQTNNCLGQSCAWIDATAADDEILDYSALFPVTSETGHGYCAPQEELQIEAAQDNYCSLCGSDASLFENNYCMPTVCNSLGACFSDNDASECLGCSDTANSQSNCYAYNSQLECSGGQNTVVQSGTVIGSNDQCSWNVCAWQDSSAGADDSAIHEFFTDSGYCFKDANGDGADDCSEFTAGELSACQVDVIAPVTSIQTDSFKVLSLAQSTLEILAVDEANPLRQIAFCLAPADASNCDNFEYIQFEGLQNEESLEINLTNSSFIKGKVIDGESYLLRYFSQDKYYNQESVKETYVFIDTKNPSFDIEYQTNTNADQSDVSAYLINMNEPMACEFTLTEVLPAGSSQTQSRARDDDLQASFENLRGVIYDLDVSCTDDYANTFSKKEQIVIDLEQDITLIYPTLGQSVSETDIEFQVETAVAAVCTLYETSSGLSLASFSASAEGKIHKTAKVSGFFEGVHAGDVMVVCEEQLTSETLEDYFDFRVDFTGPDTQIVLVEGSREERPTSFNWEQYFIESVDVNFECSSEGFACVATYYCLGDGCEYVTAEGYQEYQSTLTFDQNTKICYYSEDSSGQFGYPDCGEILIEGYGLLLVSPEGYYYEDESGQTQIIGVSNTPIFDWAFTTKVDTGLCTFDFNEGFDIYTQPEYKTIPAEDENYYLYSAFPGDVLENYPDRGDTKSLYVACEDYRGIVGPATLMNLEYDPTAPQITSAAIEPLLVTEGIETYIFIETDDRTICRFSDITPKEDGSLSGSKEFATMEYNFDGLEEKILRTNHVSNFQFSVTGAQKDFTLAVQCQNAAKDLSEVEELSFEVDYSTQGYIVSTSPSGANLPGEFQLEIQTSKNAICQVEDKKLEQTGTTTHLQSLGTLEEGEYQYAVSCRIAEVSREAQVEFTVDATAPVIYAVEDGSYSCSLDSIYFTPQSEDADIETFYYEVYQGEPTGTSKDNTLGDELGENFTLEDSPTAPVVVTTGTFPAINSSNVSVSLEENTSYFVRVSAQDTVGNLGAAVDSDGFLAISANNELCLTDDTAPTVDVVTGVGCSQVAASIECSDPLGCAELFYGMSSDSESCEANETYFGGALSFEQSGWVCYNATDMSGNEIAGSTLVDFPDFDGDGIANSCDQCSSTSAGAAVNAQGCSFKQVEDDQQSNDKDSDGLPDSWEVLFDQTTCPLDYLAQDSDDNGVLDGDEDYDNDGLKNYEEYRNGYNPCLSDAPANDVIQTDSNQDTTDSFTPPTPSASKDKGGIGILLFILGLLMILAGTGFLLHFYLQTAPGKRIVQQTLGNQRSSASANQGARNQATYGGEQNQRFTQSGNQQSNTTKAVASSTGLLAGLKNKVLGLRKVHEDKKKTKSRVGVFNEFTQETPHLGHFEEHIRSKKDTMQRLEKITDTYQEHKQEIRQGLKPHEKSVFDRLESIGKEKQKTGDISQVASKKDAQDIFKKLRKLSNARKN